MRLFLRHEPSTWLLEQMAVLDRVFANPATLKCCPHIWQWLFRRAATDPDHPPRPHEIPPLNAAVWAPGQVVCSSCWDAGVLYGVVPVQQRCDRCGVTDPTTVTLGSLTMPPYTLHTFLCCACAERESPRGTELGATQGKGTPRK